MRVSPIPVNDPCRSHTHRATPRVVRQPSETVFYREFRCSRGTARAFWFTVRPRPGCRPEVAESPTVTGGFGASRPNRCALRLGAKSCGPTATPTVALAPPAAILSASLVDALRGVSARVAFRCLVRSFKIAPRGYPVAAAPGCLDEKSWTRGSMPLSAKSTMRRQIPARRRCRRGVNGGELPRRSVDDQVAVDDRSVPVAQAIQRVIGGMLFAGWLLEAQGCSGNDWTQWLIPCTTLAR